MKKFKKSVATLALTGVMALSSIVTAPVHAAGGYSAKRYNNKLGGINYSVRYENSIGSEYYLENTGTNTMYLPQITFRYYFTNDGVDVSKDNLDVIIPVAYNMNDYVDYKNLVNVTVKELPANQKDSWRTHYIEVGFKATGNSKKDNLKPGQTIKLNLTVAAKKGAFDVYNDWSFDFDGVPFTKTYNSWIPVYWLDQKIS